MSTQQNKTTDIIAYRKEYYKQHKEKFYNPQYCSICKCFVKSQFKRHEQTKKHINLL